MVTPSRFARIPRMPLLTVVRRVDKGRPHSADGFARGRRAQPSIAGVAGWPGAALVCLIALLLLTAGTAWAQLPPQSWGPWQFRPTPPSNARGLPPPAESAPPAAQPAPYAAPWGAPAGAPAASAPPANAPPQGWPGQPGGGYPANFGPSFGPGGWPAQPPTGQYPSQYPGQYPAQYPGPYPSQVPTAQRPSASMRAPRLEVSADETRPYVQQNVLVRLRVISATSLATASPELSGFDDVLLEQLAGPETSSRRGEGGTEVVTEYVLALTPLRPGAIEVGPLEVSGTLAGGVPYVARAADKLALTVRPPEPAVQPWLALRALRLDADLDPNAVLAEGRPVGLVLTMQGDGAMGNQLPSLAGALRSEDFRVYREQTRTEQKLSDDGRRLTGTRTEYFTLVPHSGGRLQLPELRVAWWNLDTGTRETSGVPIRTFKVAGESGPFGLGRSAANRETAAGLTWLWMPLAAVALVLTGYWGGVWLRGRPRATAAGAARRPRPTPAPGLAGLPVRVRLAAADFVADTIAALGSRARAVGSALAPARLARQAGALAGRAARALTPRATRVYRCAVQAEQAPTPAAWAAAFQTHACQALQTGSREPLPRVADRIVALRPGADQARIRALIAQLDTALYNGQPLDFPRWKREFRRALRPGLGGVRSLLADRVRRGRLPELNPRPA